LVALCFYHFHKKTPLNPIIRQIIAIERDKIPEGVIRLPFEQDWDFIVLTKAYPSSDLIAINVFLEPESRKILDKNSMSYEMRQLYYIKAGQIIYFEPFNTYLEFKNNASFMIVGREKKEIRFKQEFVNPIKLHLNSK